MQSNPWKTVVITALCIVLGVFLWIFLTHSSSDMQALWLGIFLIGGPAGFTAGWFTGLSHSGLPAELREATEDAYAEGRSAGRYEGYRAAIVQEPTLEVIVPQQRKNLVVTHR